MAFNERECGFCKSEIRPDATLRNSVLTADFLCNPFRKIKSKSSIIEGDLCTVFRFFGGRLKAPTRKNVHKSCFLISNPRTENTIVSSIRDASLMPKYKEHEQEDVFYKTRHKPLLLLFVAPQLL